MWTAIRKQKAASQTISKNISLKWNFQKNCCKDPESQREALIEVLANDPRPRYQKNPERVYGIAYGENDVHFKVREEILYVCDVIKLK